VALVLLHFLRIFRCVQAILRLIPLVGVLFVLEFGNLGHWTVIIPVSATLFVVHILANSWWLWNERNRKWPLQVPRPLSGEIIMCISLKKWLLHQNNDQAHSDAVFWLCTSTMLRCNSAGCRARQRGVSISWILFCEQLYLFVLDNSDFCSLRENGRAFRESLFPEALGEVLTQDIFTV
jgi:hypothetical protein